MLENGKLPFFDGEERKAVFRYKLSQNYPVRLEMWKQRPVFCVEQNICVFADLIYKVYNTFLSKVRCAGDTGEVISYITMKGVTNNEATD